LVFEFFGVGDAFFVGLELFGVGFEFVQLFGDELLLFLELFAFFVYVLFIEEDLFELLFGLSEGDFGFEFFLFFPFELFLNPFLFLLLFFLFSVGFVLFLFGLLEPFSGLMDELV
jgi:hypothetical protein